MWGTGPVRLLLPPPAGSYTPLYSASDTSVDAPMDEEKLGEESMHFLDTVEGEIAFFRSMMRARPVGLHRHFHVLTIRNAILRDTGRSVSTDDLWRKLRSCYDLDILEGIVRGRLLHVSHPY